MQAPDTPQNETQRLAALHALQVLDTPAEMAFERMTQLARDLFADYLTKPIDIDKLSRTIHQYLTPVLRKES